MAPTGQIAPATEARFKAIADKQPLMTNAQIQQSLAQNPAVDPKVYYQWVVGYRGQQAKARMAQPPMSTSTAQTLLKSTTYDDPASLFGLVAAITTTPGVSRIPLGYYLATDQKKSYCFLLPQQNLLPWDTDQDENRGDPCVTLARPSMNTAGLPPFFIQIGQLGVTTDPTGGQSATLTDFVVVVGTDRKVYGLFNPSGRDPDPGQLGPSIRLTSGRLPGLSNTCTSVLLAANIDDLLVSDSINKSFNLTSSSFVTVGSGVTVKFGRVDSTGWSILNGVSRQFASVPTYNR